MFNQQDLIPVGELCRRYDDGSVDRWGTPTFRGKVLNHIRAGNMPHTKQWGHYYVLETDFVEWLKRYKSGAFKQGVRKRKAVDMVAVEQLSTASRA